MSYKVEFVSSAAKEYKKLPSDVQSRILTTLRILQIDPFAEILNIRKIRGRRNLFRIRMGEYRLIYSIENQSTLLIIRVRHRKDAYQGF